MVTKQQAKPAREEIGGLDRTLAQKLPPRVKFDIPLKEDDPMHFYGMGEWCEMVIEDGKETQARDYKTKEPLFWPSGDKLMELVITGVTTRDGIEQILWISGRRMRDALKAALDGAGVSGIAKGDMLRFCWTSDETTARKAGSREKLSPTKQYAGELVIS